MLALGRAGGDEVTVARARGQSARAARLLGAAQARRDALGRPVPPRQRSAYEGELATVRAALGKAAFEAAWAGGRAMSPEQVIADELSAEPPGPTPAGRSANPPSDPLTRREREVVQLIARGPTNRQIADERVIAEGATANHVKHILAKLELRSRAQVAAWAIEHGLHDQSPS